MLNPECTSDLEYEFRDDLKMRRYHEIHLCAMNQRYRLGKFR